MNGWDYLSDEEPTEGKRKMRVPYLPIGKTRDSMYALIVVCCLWIYSRVLDSYIVCDKNICLSRDLSACRAWCSYLSRDMGRDLRPYIKVYALCQLR